MTIPLILLPLILSGIFIVLFEIARATDAQMQIIWGALASFFLCASFIIYIILGIIWLCNNIKFSV